MSDFRRFHLELLAQVAKDRPLEQLVANIDEEQNDDNLTKWHGPVPVHLAASAAATAVPLPIGATKIRWLLVIVEYGAGINLHLGGAGSDAVLVKAPSTVDQQGYYLHSTDTDSLYVSNPSITDAVDAVVLMGCE